MSTKPSKDKTLGSRLERRAIVRKLRSEMRKGGTLEDFLAWITEEKGGRKGRTAKKKGGVGKY